MKRAILLVEDSMIIALDVEATLGRLGCDEVTIAGRVSEGLAQVAAKRFAAAILDLRLGEETSAAIADALLTQGTPFVFATGYDKSVAIPARFADIPVLTKPYSEENLAETLQRALKSH